MTKKTDPVIEKRICDLKREGRKTDDIVKETGIAKGTVRDILRRNGLTGKPNTQTAPNNHASAPAIEVDPTPPSNTEPSSNTPPDRRGRINPNLSQEKTANEILDYIEFFRKRTKQIPFMALSEHDLVWAETNYGKRWAEGIKMMIETTGLSKEAVMAIVEDFENDLSGALERFNSKYRGER